MKALPLLLAALLLIPSPLIAGELNVTVKEAVQRALDRNRLLKAAGYRKEAADRGAAASRSRWFPRIFLQEGFSASNSPTRVFMMKLDQGRFTQDDFQIANLNNPSSETDFSTAFSLEQPVFDASILYGAEIAGTEAEQEDLTYRQRAEETGLLAVSACLQVRKAEEMLAAAEMAVRDAEEHRRLATVRRESGTGLKSDELRAEAFLAEMEERRITAENDLRLAGMRLSLVTGGEPGESLGVSGGVPDLGMGPSEGELEGTALANRKDLKALEKETEKARTGVKLANGAFLPTLHAVAGYRMDSRDVPFGRDNDAWSVGVDLRWELFDGLRRFDERARAKALESSATEYLEEMRREVAYQVRESVLRRQEAEQRLRVARASFRDAEEGVRLVAKRFANSLSTLVEVLDAQTALNRARVSVVENETGYALAQARVLYSAGILLREVMK